MGFIILRSPSWQRIRMEDALASIDAGLKEIERKDEEDLKLEIKRQQAKIQQATSGFAALPSQCNESVQLHQAIVEGMKKHSMRIDKKKLFLLKKAKRKQSRKARRAEMVAEKMGEKRNRT